MMQLLDHNPDNMIALDYILCSDLLLKDITNFKRDYDRYCSDKPRLKPLYQEALCIWLAGSDASQEEAEEAAKAAVASQLEGKTVRKVIYVPGKLVNIVA